MQQTLVFRIIGSYISRGDNNHFNWYLENIDLSPGYYDFAIDADRDSKLRDHVDQVDGQSHWRLKI